MPKLLRHLTPIVALPRWIAGLAEPWFLLALRVLLAQAFLVLQISMAMSGKGLTSAFHGSFWVDSFERAASTGWGGAVEATCAILLAAGLLTRPAAVALLLQVVLLRHDGWQHLHGFWTILLLGLVVFGPGALSLDRVLGAGVRNSALPGVRVVATLYERLRTWGAPTYLALLRVTLVAVVAAPHVGPASHLHAMMAGQLPPTPGMIAAVPVAGATLAATLLLLGLAVRPTALVLLLLVPMPGSLGLSAETSYWVAMLGLLFVAGAGALSLDRLLGHALRAEAETPDLAALPHIVVVGGGFGGHAVVHGLRDAACRVTLIDKHNYHLFQPLLYQVATAGLSPADIATPIRGMFRDQANARVVLGEVTGVDKAARLVRLGTSSIAYDALVLATGARHSYFGRDEWSGVAPGLKTIEDATAIRCRLLSAFEAAETATDAAARAAWLTFVIVGGGPTGVELAGAIAELARFGLKGEFRGFDPADARIVLVQSGPRLLPAFPEPLSQEAAAALRRLGVEVMLDGKAQAIDAGGVTIGRDRIAARTVLWAAGVTASPAANWVGAMSDRAGRVHVGPDLRVPGCGEIFAIGDTCASAAWAGAPVPGLAPAAKQQGAYVAQVIKAGLRGRSAPAPFRYRHYGSLATIGRKAAVADFGRLRVTGAPAWWLWGTIHIAFLVGGRSRAGVVLEWVWDYFTMRRGTRLITGPAAMAIEP